MAQLQLVGPEHEKAIHRVCTEVKELADSTAKRHGAYLSRRVLPLGHELLRLAPKRQVKLHVLKQVYEELASGGGQVTPTQSYLVAVQQVHRQHFYPKVEHELYD